MSSRAKPRHDSPAALVVHLFATVTGGLGLAAGATGVGMAPSTLAAVEDPHRWLAACMFFLAVGVASLALARWLRPWHQRPEREAFGGIVGWLAWTFGALVFGSGGELFGLAILAAGAFVLDRRRRRNRTRCEADGTQGPSS